MTSLNNNRLWILGAADPEMEMIESLLRAAGESLEHAYSSGGTDRHARVHPGEASDARFTGPWSPGTTLYFVECAQLARGPHGDCAYCGAEVVDDHRCGVKIVVIDHHKPGDPGYGRLPTEYWEASSLGQTVTHLLRIADASDCAQSPTGAGNGRNIRRAIFGGTPDTAWCADPIAVGAPTERVGRPDACGVWVSFGPAAARDTGTFLGRLPQELLFVAAADHCLCAAYAGQCPGVNISEFGRWRVATRAKHQGRSVEAVLADVERATEIIKGGSCAYHGRMCLRPDGSMIVGLEEEEAHCEGCYAASQRPPAPRIRLVAEGASVRAVIEGRGGDEVVVDLRGRPGGTIPELPEAACRLGLAYLARVPAPDGRTKVVLGGSKGPAVSAFLGGWATARGLTELYGDPARGFAGGYEAERSVWIGDPAVASLGQARKLGLIEAQSITEAEIARIADGASVTWVIAPKDQGQMVERAYSRSVYDGVAFERVTDRSARTVEYRRLDLDDAAIESWDPANGQIGERSGGAS